MREKSKSDYKLLSGLFYRLLPYHILLIVINAINGIVDSMYASNYLGKTAMSAIGLYGPINHFLYAATMLFVSGSQILYGRYLAQDRKHINSVFTIDILIALGMGVLTATLMVVGVLTGATRVLVKEEADLQMLNQYILGQAAGIPALILGQQLFTFLSLENQKKRTMVASVVCFVANAILNHLFVAVEPISMGIFGLGLSSAISFWVFLAILAVFYLRGKSEWKFSLKACQWKEDLPKIIRLGYPGAILRFVEMFRCLIVNFLVLQYVGTVGISSFAASNSVMAVLWPVPYGMVAVVRMLYSISIGEKDRRSLIDVTRIVLTRGMMIVLGIVALLVIAAEPLTRLFYQDVTDPVYQMTVNAFRIISFCMPLSIISLTFAAYAQSMEKKTLSILLPIVDGVVGVVLFSFILIPGLKMDGLYIANILNGVLCFAVVFFMAWRERKKMPKNLEQLMAIPDSFGAAENERIDITVRSTEEVVDISRQIIDFCNERGIESRRAYFAGLCMEEMAGNTIIHGFENSKKHRSVDIRVVLDGEDIIMRIRDNCSAFNPLEFVQAMDSDNSGHNIGIQLAYKLAKDVNYQNLLGLNVLQMRI